jgi:hypothetical protein
MTQSIIDKPYSPYIPQTLGEIWDKLGSMMLDSPTFVDKLGEFPGMNIDTQFFALKESFKVVRRKLGEERYEKLVALADRARAHFEADPEDKTEDIAAGRRLLTEIEDIIRDARPKRKPSAKD